MTTRTLAALLLMLLAGCGGAPSGQGKGGADAAADPAREAPQLTREQVLAMLDDAEVSALDFEEVSATFELGSRATDLQRERMSAALTNTVVEWDLEVYEVRASDDNYEIVSEPAAARHAEASALLRVAALVIPRDDADRALIEALQTGSRIRLRGLV
ncbi:MAG: hypothetical protein RL026_563, partial [Pseudomonadota bacterium]